MGNCDSFLPHCDKNSIDKDCDRSTAARRWWNRTAHLFFHNVTKIRDHHNVTEYFCHSTKIFPSGFFQKQRSTPCAENLQTKKLTILFAFIVSQGYKYFMCRDPFQQKQKGFGVNSQLTLRYSYTLLTSRKWTWKREKPFGFLRPTSQLLARLLPWKILSTLCSTSSKNFVQPSHNGNDSLESYE